MTTVDPELVRISKRMSFVLRHDPASHGVTLDPQGWVDIDVLLRALRPVTREQLDEVVAANDKRRFEVRDGRIRAAQGHSRRVPVDLGLEPADPPPTLFHGTPATNVAAILAQGLRPGGRHHVHLSADLDTATAVGRRRGTAEVILTVAAGRMAADGHTFYRSANGVWLTDAVPAEYLAALR